MANEFKHITVGTELTQAEFELITAHQFASQATGDLLYASSATQLSRLGIGATGAVLAVVGGIPAWAAAFLVTPTLITTDAPIRYSTGRAITAAQYESGRDADGTNQYHINVPTGAGMEWSINDVSRMAMDANGHISIGGTPVLGTLLDLNNSFTATGDQPQHILLQGTITTPSGGYTSYGARFLTNVTSGGGTQALFQGIVISNALTGTWTRVEGLYVDTPNGGTVSNPYAIRLGNPRAIGAAAVNLVGISITDMAAGDARLGIQAESGSPIYLGNNAVHISGQNVLGAQGALVADADGTLASVNAQLNTLLARVRTHGLIAT